jgi:hypothetical protein
MKTYTVYLQWLPVGARSFKTRAYKTISASSTLEASALAILKLNRLNEDVEVSMVWANTGGAR